MCHLLWRSKPLHFMESFVSCDSKTNKDNVTKQRALFYLRYTDALCFLGEKSRIFKYCLQECWASNVKLLVQSYQYNFVLWQIRCNINTFQLHGVTAFTFVKRLKNPPGSTVSWSPQPCICDRNENGPSGYICSERKKELAR